MNRGDLDVVMGPACTDLAALNVERRLPSTPQMCEIHTYSI
jgi:hypothetical protein